MFSVRILERQAPIGRGEIVVNGLREEFESSLEYWTAKQYEAQWWEALRGITSSESMTALISSITDPRTANFFCWWPLYKEGESVFVQNQVLMLDEVRERFSLDRIIDFVPVRETADEDGNPISEWQTSVEEISAFLEMMPR